MGRQDPVPTFNDADLLKELAKEGSMPTILKRIGREEQRFRYTATSACNAGVDIMAIGVPRVGVVNKPLNHGIPDSVRQYPKEAQDTYKSHFSSSGHAFRSNCSNFCAASSLAS